MLSQCLERFEREGRDGAQLRAAFVTNVRRTTRRYPDCWFIHRQRDDDAIEDLADRTFTVCARVPKGRFPFLARTPFRAYLEESFDDRAIRWHSFDARLSIMREILREDYAFNCRHDPDLRWRDALHREIGAALPQVATLRADGWVLTDRGLRRVRPIEQVEDELRGARGPVPELVVRALRALGTPISHSRLTNLLADAMGGPDEPLPPPDAPMDNHDRATVRDAVLTAWTSLPPVARALLAGLARDEDADALIAKHPELKSRVGVSRALKAVGEAFATSLATAMGQPVALDATPRTLLENVLDVLLPLIDALETP